MKLSSYLMTNDSGFAPNIEEDVLTLATCNPVIRRVAEVGDWLAGWISKTLARHVHTEFISNKRILIYLARITGKISFKEYWKGNTLV